MASTAIIDRTDTLSLVERLGVIRRMQRRCRIIGIEDSDYAALNSTLNTLGVPEFGDPLIDDPTLSPDQILANQIAFQMLILCDREVNIVDDDPSTFDVTLTYEHLMDGPYQNLLNPTSGVIWGKTACSVTQKTTNFFRFFGGINVFPDGNPVSDMNDQQVSTLPQRILTGHTYRVEDKTDNPPGYVGPQGGEVNVFVPQRSFKVEGYINTGNPSQIARLCIGAVNYDVWLGDGKYEWMCTEVQYEVLTSQGLELPGRYKFFFEWQHNSDTWNPTSVFTYNGKPPPHLEMNQDPLFQPPAGLTMDTTNPNSFNAGPIKPGQEYGYSYIPYHRVVSFDAIFGATFADWAPGVL